MSSWPYINNRLRLIYRDEWNDGFGARGWKLEAAIADPDVIACTAHSGGKSPTSVIVHDILDHFVSGFALSGCLHEAQAIVMHGLRNSIEVRSSFEWLVDDILRDPASDSDARELLAPLLPAPVRACCRSSTEMVERVGAQLGTAQMRARLIQRLIGVGLGGVRTAMTNWERRHLPFERMADIGFCVQELLEKADDAILANKIAVADALLDLSDDVCRLELSANGSDEHVHLEQPV